jgi:Leucine-rich repeat (LRR) protein
MKAGKRWIIAVAVLSICAMPLRAQQSKQAKQAKVDTKEHEQKVRDMVAFLEYVLNTLGSRETSARDKDVLITESYTKIFRDAKVQIEDDLVEKRNVITNKDVQAYLKDVDFFYDDITFEFSIKDIQGKVNANDKLFYKVSLVRNIKGVNVEGKVVNNSIPRYIEINYDPLNKDLKIVSIYTKEFNEKVALQHWWKELSLEWQAIFKRKLNIVSDSIQLSDIKNITSIDAMDLSQNKYIQNLEPLTQLADLQVLDLSGTAITDLSPLRNLTSLVELNVSNTRIEDLSPLKYSDKLKKFNINRTAVSDISVLEKMTLLESLEISSTNVVDFAPLGNLLELRYLNLKSSKITSLAPLENLKNLTELNASQTMIDNLSPLATLTNLSILNLDSTRFTDVSMLKTLENLKVLYVNHTVVSNLRPLEGLKQLERIYCDHSSITRSVADAFMVSNPKVLVIFDSEDLRGWWNVLPAAWKDVLSKAASIELIPTKEELAKVTNLDSISITENIFIQDIEPLRNLQKLQVVYANKTAIKDLSPLKDQHEIRILDISDTQINDIAVVTSFTKLRLLRADNTDIQNLDALQALPNIQKIYVDQTAIDNSLVEEFLRKRPTCLVVYKTDNVETWWNELPDGWKEVFQTQISISPKSRREDLHRLIELEALHFKDAAVSDLLSLSAFVRLKELDFSGTGISDLTPISNVKSLRTLQATNSPIRELAPLAVLISLEELDISNTPVEELKPLRSLENLKSLNCSGTQISSLSYLEALSNLESIDFSNTSVKSIDAISNMSLKILKCYNTRVSSKAIQKFKDSHPDCNVIYYR